MERKTEAQIRRDLERKVESERKRLQEEADYEIIKHAQVEIGERTISAGASWEARALCSSDEVDPGIFDIESDDRDSIKRARRYCGACAVQAVCLEKALDPRNPEMELFWGNTTPDERRALRRRTRRAALWRQG